MYSDMSMRIMACSSSNRNSASARASSVLPTPVGPRKMNEPIGRRGSLRPARERRMAVGDARQRFVLADDALPQTLFHRDQLLHFAFQHLRNRNAGPLADDLGDVFLVNLFLQHARLLAVHRRAELGDLSFELRQLAVLDLRGAVVIALARGFLLLELQRARCAPSARALWRWLPSPASSAPSARWPLP